jgi:putative ABC transport system ATP-binding protein
MLELDDVTKAYGPGPAVLSQLSLRIAPGEYVAVMGESGTGKSTLLNLIAGLDRPDSGRICLGDTDLTSLDDAGCARLRRARMGFVFQAFHLLPYLTVARNVALPLALNGVTGTAADTRVEQLLDAVGLSHRRDRLPGQLSGGEMQRVAVARALVHRPQIVLADEPTGNLDAKSAAEVIALLRAQLKEDRAAGILVTHSQLAAASTDRIYVLTPQGLVAERLTSPWS